MAAILEPLLPVSPMEVISHTVVAKHTFSLILREAIRVVGGIGVGANERLIKDDLLTVKRHSEKSLVGEKQGN